MPEKLGPILVLAGLAVVVLGLLAWAGLLSWFGRLPGDIRVDRENVKVFFPVTTMILLSVVVSVALALARKLF